MINQHPPVPARSLSPFKESVRVSHQTQIVLEVCVVTFASAVTRGLTETT